MWFWYLTNDVVFHTGFYIIVIFQQSRARGLGVMTSPLQGEGRRFKSGRAHSCVLRHIPPITSGGGRADNRYILIPARVPSPSVRPDNEVSGWRTAEAR